MANRNIKCPLCDYKNKDKRMIYEHMERVHDDAIPKDISVQQYFYNLTRGVTTGSCVVCKGSTDWNTATDKYNRFCNNPKCKDEYREIFKKRMIGKYGKVHLLNNPKIQQKMLENRKISGKYEWSDGSDTKVYTGTYEHKFLEFCDSVLDLPSSDVITPSPFIFCYSLRDKPVSGSTKYFTEDEYDNMPENVKTTIAEDYLLYRPDAYIPSINLIVEIKHGGDNPNMHHKIQEVDVLKDEKKEEVMKTQKYFNYMKITDNKYGSFLTYFANLKYFEEQIVINKKPNVIIGESVDMMSVGVTLNIVTIRALSEYIVGFNTDGGSKYYFHTGESLDLSEIGYGNLTVTKITVIPKAIFNAEKLIEMCKEKYMTNDEYDMRIREMVGDVSKPYSDIPADLFYAKYKTSGIDTTKPIVAGVNEVLLLIESLGGDGNDK